MGNEKESKVEDEKYVDIFFQITDENRQMIEDIRDNVIRSALEEDDTSEITGSSSSSNISPLSIQHLLRSNNTQPTSSGSGSDVGFLSSISMPPLTMPTTFNPFHLALCQTLVATSFPTTSSSASTFNMQPTMPLFFPQSQSTMSSIPFPAVESAELLRILQNILGEQRK